jgi:hypothetical protein
MPISSGRVQSRPRVQFRLGPLVVEPATRRIVHDDGREEFLEPRVI